MVVTTVLKKPNTINRSINNNAVSRDTLLNELDKYKIQVSNIFFYIFYLSVMVTINTIAVGSIPTKENEIFNIFISLLW